MDIAIYLEDHLEEDDTTKNKLVLPDDVIAKLDKLRKDNETRKEAIIREA